MYRVGYVSKNTCYRNVTFLSFREAPHVHFFKILPVVETAREISERAWTFKATRKELS